VFHQEETMSRKLKYRIALPHLSVIAGLLLTVLLGVAPAQANPQTGPVIPGAWTKRDTPVISTNVSGAWDDQITFAPSVLLDGSTYKMWYAGSRADSVTRKIGYAFSADGIAWVRYGSAPVFDAGPSGAWDAKISFPAVIKDGGVYKMWYTGLDAANYGQIGYATSPDGLAWTRYAGNPVLSFGAGSSWDAEYVGAANVVKAGGMYHLWYRGGVTGGIGYATSPDGIAWTKSAANPVLASGSGGWDDSVYSPRVVFDGAGYHLWYSGCDPSGDLCQVGYATSADGAHWTRRGMVLPPGAAGAWDAGGVDHAAVMLVGDAFKLWYSGFDGTNYRIGYAYTGATLLDQSIYIPLVVK
jgi:predicted GH43/DUF377 family glycosyl hydrolase